MICACEAPAAASAEPQPSRSRWKLRPGSPASVQVRSKTRRMSNGRPSLPLKDRSVGTLARQLGKARGGANRLKALKIGGASRDRTGDLNTASVALSQLSYGPKNRTRMIGRWSGVVQPPAYPPFASILAQESRSVTMRLNTSRSGVESLLSCQK